MLRSRKEPICDVEIGHRSISVAHPGANAREANQWLSREQRKPYDYSFIA